jgi:hypothetical protein
MGVGCIWVLAVAMYWSTVGAVHTCSFFALVVVCYLVIGEEQGVVMDHVGVAVVLASVVTK